VTVSVIQGSGRRACVVCTDLWEIEMTELSVTGAEMADGIDDDLILSWRALLLYACNSDCCIKVWIRVLYIHAYTILAA